jgi:hypothetical protein
MPFDRLRRREFIMLLGGAAAWPLTVRAQQAPKLPTIGFLGATTPSADGQRFAAFVQRLRELGWIEGRNVAIEVRWAQGGSERFCRDSSRIYPAEGRRHSHAHHPAGPGSKAGDICHPDRVRPGSPIRSAPATSPAWGGRVGARPQEIARHRRSRRGAPWRS